MQFVLLVMLGTLFQLNVNYCTIKVLIQTQQKKLELAS